MNNKIFIVLALASIFIASTQAALVCNDANCKTCTDQSIGACTVCNTGFGLVSGGTCTACTATNCNTCDTTVANCATCKAGFGKVGTGSAAVCNACTSTGGQCTACDTTVSTCTACNAGYGLVSAACTACTSTGGQCKTCDTTASTCTACNSAYGLVSAACTACTSTGGQCTTCDTTAATCTVCAAGYGLTSGACSVCTATNCATCSAPATCTACNAGYALVSGACVLCTAGSNCATCPAAAATCTQCNSGYGLVTGATCTICTASNCMTCDSAVGTCTVCKTGYTKTGTGTSTTCVSTTPVPSTNSPATSAFNVTPTAVFLATETTAPAFAAISGPVIYGPGFTDATAYVWAIVVPTVTGVVSVNRRTLNATFGSALAKLNSSDSAITTSVPSTATLGSSAAVAPGYFAFASYVAGTNWGGVTTLGATAAATASEVSVTYIAVNGTSATTKAITGNTNTNVYFKLQNLWIDTGVIYITYTMSTHTPGAVAATGVTAAADTWALNGLYIQGITISTGALLYNTTGGVKALALTQSSTGPSTGCVNAASSSSICVNSAPSSSISAFTVGGINITNSTAVNYLWTDTSATGGYAVIKTGTITLATGAATSGTALATEAVSTGAGTPTSPTISTNYYQGGFLGSYATSGVFVGKSVGTYTGTGSTTYVWTIAAYINGSSTAASNVTIVSGYRAPVIMGYGTSDGFVLVEQHTAQTTPTNNQNKLIQVERFFTNGSTNGATVNLGTYQDQPNFYQDTNGSIYLGYTISDVNTGNTYSGMLGKYLAQTLASGASTLTSIFAFLSLMIVALFAF